MMKMMITALVFAACLMGCTHGTNDDNLSSVPVTNNPNLFPRSQTAQTSGFGS